MRTVTAGLTGVYAYLDDLIVATETWVKHMIALGALLDRLQEYNLTANPKKCILGCSRVEYLGHDIGGGDFRPLSEQVKDIQQTPLPTSKTGIRSFLGAVGYYRRFVDNYAKLAGPLELMTKKGEPEKLIWTAERQDYFKQLAIVLSLEPILQLPNLKRPFVLRTDACDYGIGCALMQESNANPLELHPVAYASRRLKGAELNYSTIEKEALAIVWSVEKFYRYLYGKHFELHTDHKPLVYL